MNYLDDTTGKGRRVDINFQPGKISDIDNNNNLLLLQALLWSARKIDNVTTYTTETNTNNLNFDVNNI